MHGKRVLGTEIKDVMTYRVKNQHPTEQVDSLVRSLARQVVQSGKSRLKNKNKKCSAGSYNIHVKKRLI